MELQTLQDMAFDQLGYLISNCKEEMTAANLRPREYLESKKLFLNANIPRSYHNRLSKFFLNTIARSERRRIQNHRADDNRELINEIELEIILGLHITSFCLLSTPDILWDELYEKLHRMYELKELCVTVKSYSTHVYRTRVLINDAVTFMPKLLSFTYWFYCSDRTIENLAKYCKHLRVLDVNFSVEITSKCVPHLLAFENLTNLAMRNTNLDLNAYETIMLNLPHLTTLQEHSNMDKVLEDFEARVPDRKFKITNFISSNLETRHLKLLLKFYPQLTSLELDSSKIDWSVDVEFPHLRELSLYNVHFYTSNLEIFLNKSCKNIIHLYFRRVEGFDISAVIGIAKACPEVQKLIIEDCFYLNEVPLTDDDLSVHNIFMHVQYLEILDDMQSDVFQFLMSVCFNVKTLILFNLPGLLENDIMAQILPKNPLSYLEEIYVNDNSISALLALEDLVIECRSLKYIYGLNMLTDLTFLSYTPINFRFPNFIHSGAIYIKPITRNRFSKSGIFKGLR